GWSHKYEMLFRDYDFPEGIINVTAREQEIYNKLDMLIQAETYRQIQTTITAKSRQLQQRSEAMWNEVFEIINEAK
ncbi:MAG: hypothetical protein R6U19_01630, partial [Bacteroidales bacterium]